MSFLKSKGFLFILVFVSFLLFSGCTKDSLVDDISEVDELVDAEETTIENEILELVNAHRASLGKSPLAINIRASQLAEEHTEYMISEGDISHDNFDARAEVLFQEENASGVGENVAYGYRTAQSVMEAWINSTGHRENIEGNFTHIGISAIKNTSGTYYYTQLFLRK